MRGLSARTERLRLRPLVESDAGEYVRVLRASREAWAPWTPARDATVSESELFQRELRRATEGARTGTHLRLGAFETRRVAGDGPDTDGALVGLFGLNEIVRGAFQSAYASWQVAGDRLEERFGTEGVRALLGLAFDEPPRGLGLHRVQANVMPTNAASLRMAKKVGFRREGLGERYLRIAGRWEDHLLLAITLEEWHG